MTSKNSGVYALENRINLRNHQIYSAEMTQKIGYVMFLVLGNLTYDFVKRYR